KEIRRLSASLFDKEKQEVRGQEVLEERSVQPYVTDRETRIGRRNSPLISIFFDKEKQEVRGQEVLEERSVQA
ncbi:hypothetical protein CHH78_21925, partial [Shouchella clausii]|uniref:hypothetical protein n=1 Tax=Shouchella clausii TaxID=79880 RepID=UPI000BDB1FFD